MGSFNVDKSFPKHFSFGVADADLQVIGEQSTLEKEQSSPSMWLNFAKNSGKCYLNQTPLVGVDRYHRWSEDVKLISDLGVGAYRCSISMARLLTPQGQINQNAVEWYRQYFKALTEKNVQIYATLYHWELPQFLNDRGGWVNRETVDWLIKHAIASMELFGDLIQDFFILNEPWCSSMLSYHLGVHAPGHENIMQSLIAAHHLLLAQGMIVRKAKDRFPQLRLGTVYNVQSCYAMSTDPKDCFASTLANDYFNGWFFEPTYLGKYPELMLDRYAQHLPFFSCEDLEIIQVGQLLDYLGINYYHGSLNRYSHSAEFGFESVVDPSLGTNDLGWPIFTPPQYPCGLYDILTELYYRYVQFGLTNIMVSENGMALKSASDQGEAIVTDTRRVVYLQDHLSQVYQALLKGVPVSGYFVWTLLDNYEWAEGYRPEACFGLVQVDRNTLNRIPKQSYYWYQSVCQTKTLVL